ncbi:discoidin domain-containing protein [Spirochaetota bacterium]
MKKPLLLSISTLVMLCSFLYAQHISGMVKGLTIEIVFSDYAYLLPSGEPVYITDSTMKYRVTIINNSKRTYNNILAQASLHSADDDSLLPGSSVSAWVSADMEKYGNTSFDVEYNIIDSEGSGTSYITAAIKHKTSENVPDHATVVTFPIPIHINFMAYTPVPTNTPTLTPLPTATPLPTHTPTNTPIPTNTPTDTPVPTNTPVPFENIALGKPSSASSDKGTFFDSSKAFDGYFNTRWASLSNDPQWITVDLKNMHYIDSIVLFWNYISAKVFEVRLSDDSVTWTTVFSDIQGDNGIDYINTIESYARYVQIFCIKQNTGFGYSIWEIEVWGRQEEKPVSSDPLQKTIIQGNIVPTKDSPIGIVSPLITSEKQHAVFIFNSDKVGTITSVILSIYSIQGKEICKKTYKNLHDNSIKWNVHNYKGNKVMQGTYYYTIEIINDLGKQLIYKGTFIYIR